MVQYCGARLRAGGDGCIKVIVVDGAGLSPGWCSAGLILGVFGREGSSALMKGGGNEGRGGGGDESSC